MLGTHRQTRLSRLAITPRWAAVLLVCAAGAAAGAFALVRGASPPAKTGISGVVGPGAPSTLARPMGPGAKQVSLSEAASALGGPVVLPNTTEMMASDVGAVWMYQSHGDTVGDTSTSVAVTFPSQDVYVLYARPSIAEPLVSYKQLVSQAPGSQVVYLNGGVPALAIAQLPDGSNFGSVKFVADGTTIIVLGHSSESSLQGIAQSILDRANAAG